jgi:hypothetical protein
VTPRPAGAPLTAHGAPLTADRTPLTAGASAAAAPSPVTSHASPLTSSLENSLVRVCLHADGTCDLSMVIRTILVAGRTAYAQVGGGIVADSLPEAEYQETLDKGKALIQALKLSSEVAVETAR